MLKPISWGQSFIEEFMLWYGRTVYDRFQCNRNNALNTFAVLVKENYIYQSVFRVFLQTCLMLEKEERKALHGDHVLDIRSFRPFQSVF